MIHSSQSPDPIIEGPADGAVTIHRLSLEQFRGVQPQWDSIAFASAYGGPMLSHAWLSTTTRFVGSNRTEFFIYIAKRGPEPVAIGAFELDRGFCRMLRVAGGQPLLDAAGVAYLTGEEAVGLEIIRTAVASAQFDRLELAGLPPVLAHRCVQLPIADRTILRDAKILADFQSQNWNEYRRVSLGAKFRRELDREERRLGEAGRIALSRIEDARLAIATLGRLHILRCGRRGHRSQFGGGWLGFLYSHARQAAWDGRLASYQLLLDGEPIAAILVLEHASRAWMTHVAFDPVYHRYGPGMILIHRTLEDEHGRGLQTFDFGVGDLPFKRQFGKREEPWFAVSGRSSGVQSWVRSAPANTVEQLTRGPVRSLGRRALLLRAGGVNGQLASLALQLEADPEPSAPRIA